MNSTDQIYRTLLRWVHDTGEVIESRNHSVRSVIDLPSITFSTFPLVTLRRTAWKMALREMEWFLSGKTQCPDTLLPWWEGQLNVRYDIHQCYSRMIERHHYVSGYGHQLRHFDGDRLQRYGLNDGYDQVDAFLNGIILDPFSRRHIMTTWHPFEMANIALINNNTDCPATCHGTLVQGFVRDNSLFMNVYQRSADLLLGVPHNWVQWWGFLLWAANQSGLGVGTLRWIAGDAHIYQSEDHLEVMHAILDADEKIEDDCTLCYEHNTNDFRADDFTIIGNIPHPVVSIKPRRF